MPRGRRERERGLQLFFFHLWGLDSSRLHVQALSRSLHPRPACRRASLLEALCPCRASWLRPADRHKRECWQQECSASTNDCRLCKRYSVSVLQKEIVKRPKRPGRGPGPEPLEPGQGLLCSTLALVGRVLRVGGGYSGLVCAAPKTPTEAPQILPLWNATLMAVYTTIMVVCILPQTRTRQNRSERL